MVPVESSTISSVGYDESTQRLSIQFKSGATYDYANVPASIHESLMDAPSVGSFFAAYIKPYPERYPFTKRPAPVPASIVPPLEERVAALESETAALRRDVLALRAQLNHHASLGYRDVGVHG